MGERDPAGPIFSSRAEEPRNEQLPDVVEHLTEGRRALEVEGVVPLEDFDRELAPERLEARGEFPETVVARGRLVDGREEAAERLVRAAQLPEVPRDGGPPLDLLHPGEPPGIPPAAMAG